MRVQHILLVTFNRIISEEEEEDVALKISLLDRGGKSFVVDCPSSPFFVGLSVARVPLLVLLLLFEGTSFVQPPTHASFSHSLS